MAGAGDVWSHCSHQEAETRIKVDITFKTVFQRSTSVSQTPYPKDSTHSQSSTTVSDQVCKHMPLWRTFPTQKPRHKQCVCQPHFHSSSLAYFIFFSVYFSDIGRPYIAQFPRVLAFQTSANTASCHLT